MKDFLEALFIVFVIAAPSAYMGHEITMIKMVEEYEDIIYEKDSAYQAVLTELEQLKGIENPYDYDD